MTDPALLTLCTLSKHHRHHVVHDLYQLESKLFDTIAAIYPFVIIQSSQKREKHCPTPEDPMTDPALLTR